MVAKHWLNHLWSREFKLHLSETSFSSSINRNTSKKPFSFHFVWALQPKITAPKEKKAPKSSSGSFGAAVFAYPRQQLKGSSSGAEVRADGRRVGRRSKSEPLKYPSSGCCALSPLVTPISGKSLRAGVGKPLKDAARLGPAEIYEPGRQRLSQRWRT